MKAIRCESIITSFRSRNDGSLGGSFVTPELSSQEKVNFMELQGVVTEMLVYPKDAKDAEVMEVRKELEGKTHCQKQRGVIFLIWKRLGERETFEAYYGKRMEQNIEKLKAELEGL